MQSTELAIMAAGELVIDCRSQISVNGKGRTDKQLGILRDGVTSNTLAYAATKAGKVGKVAREGSADFRLATAAKQAAIGNFTLLYEIIVLETAKQLQPIRSKSDYVMARGFVRGLRDNLKNDGVSNSGKLTSERQSLDQVLTLFDACDAAMAEQQRKDAERRAKEAAEREATPAIEQAEQPQQ